MIGTTRTFQVTPEHLKRAIEFFVAYPDANRTEGCLMNQALRDVFSDYGGGVYVNSDMHDGNDFFKCSQTIWQNYNGEIWTFDSNGQELVQHFDQQYDQMIDAGRGAEAFLVPLPATVEITLVGTEEERLKANA